MTPSAQPADMLWAPVRVHDLRVGTVTGVFADASFERLIGLDVTGRAGKRWFLPFVAASQEDDGVVRLDSALVLVETADLDGYGRQGALLVRDEERLREVTVDRQGCVLRDARSVSSAAAAGTSAA